MSSVLIVDDKEENLYYLDALLKGHGFTVASARHGAAALVLARQSPPDLVISDLLMPVMDGYTLLRHWKADARLRGIPFVVYTATYTEPEDERLAISLGADAFILKPAEPHEFMARICDVQAAVKAAAPRLPSDPVGSGEANLQSYSEILIRKLEEKTLQLEETNRALEHDIAERRAAESALRASEAEFRLLAESLPQIVWIARPDGSNAYFSQKWTEYTGLTLEDSLAHGWSASVHPDDRPRALEAWQRAMATHGPYSLECRLRRADGTYKWWLVRGLPVCGDDGQVLKWFGTFTDIHDLKLAELAILASNERFARVFHSGLVAIGITETSTNRIVEANQRFAEAFGYEPAEIVGRTGFDLGLWADDAGRQRLMTAGASRSRGQEVTFVRRSGETCHALVATEPMTLPGADEALSMTVLIDITERKQLEAQLVQAQKMEAVGRLAGGVAHDFNNALGVILGYAEILMRRADAVDRVKLEQIYKTTQRASGLTRQLLAFSRKEVIDPKVLDLNTLVTNLYGMMGRLLGEDIDLQVVTGAELGRVKADPGQLEQIVINLCVNARDAMPNGGALRLETANVDVTGSGVPEHDAVAPGRYVMLTVRDTGCGISPQILSKIFEPFFTTKEQGKGTGLGLAMVYGAVKHAGGSIEVDSEVGHGTVFRIYLPRVDDALAVEPVAEAAPVGGTETILLVEDEDSLRLIAREILEEHGYQVIASATPREAIERVRRHAGPIHLLVTDVVMPGMNGRALAETLGAARPGLAVLYMSGYTDDVIAHRGVLDPGTLFIEKPFTAAALLHQIRRAIGSSRA